MKITKLVLLVAALVSALLVADPALAERNPIAFNAAGFDPERAQFSLLAVAMSTQSVDMLAGHVMIRVRQDDLDYTFDWGNYNAKKSGFVLSYIKGDISFEHQVRPLSSTLRSYKKENRLVEEYKMQLTRDQKARILANFVEWAKPEHRTYHYDFALENCSTAIRDIIGDGLGPQFKAFYDRPSHQTYRTIGMPHFYNFPAVLPLAELGLAAPTDRALQNWDLFFLPLAGFDMYRTSPAYDDSGAPVPNSHLLDEPTTLQAGERAELGTVRWSLVYGAALSLLAMVGFGLRRLAKDPSASNGQRKAGTYFLAAALGIAGLFFGLLASLLLAVWAFTGHKMAFQNFNLAFLWPVDFVLLGFGWRLLRNDCFSLRPKLSRAVVVYFGLHLALGALVALGSLLRVVPQDVRVAAVLSLPLWLVAFLESRAMLTPKNIEPSPS